MGDIAEGLINGDFDFYTGEYIGRGYGYPRTVNRSLPWERRGKRDWKNRKLDPRKGVINYINIQYCGRPRMPKATKIARHFFSDMGAEFISEEKMYESISANFGVFVQWMNDNKIKMSQLYAS